MPPPTSVSPVPTLTPRGERTRATLKRAGRILFERNGFRDTSIDSISVRANVAHGTFYRYFDSKDQLFAEIVDDLYADFNTVMSQQPDAGTDLSARIERTNRGYLTAYMRNAKFMAAVEQATTLSPALRSARRHARVGWIERNAAAISRWQRRGAVSRFVEPSSAAEMLGSMVDRTAYVSIVLDEHVDLEHVARELTALYCRALGIAYFREVTQSQSPPGSIEMHGTHSVHRAESHTGGWHHVPR